MSLLEQAPRALLLAGAAVGAYSLYAWYATRRFETLEPESAGAPGAFLDADGVRVHYVEAGRGETLVLIHGLGASTFSYRHTIPELAQHYRVVALDLKGFGYSERPKGGDYSLTVQAALVERVMDRLGIERATVVGHSMGGNVAMRLALRCPERVTKLVLVDSASDREMLRGAGLTRFLQFLLPLVAPFTVHRRGFRRVSLRTAVHDPAHLTPEVLDGYFRPAQMKGNLRAFGALMAHRGNDEPLALEQIVQPTLILWGEHDRWLPPSRGEDLARRIPNAKLVLVPSAGHLPLEEQPDFCNRALLDFLRASEAASALQAERAEQLETTS